MTDTPTPPGRPPAPGPAVILDQRGLYQAVQDEMERRGYTHAKDVCADTGLDQTSLGRFLRRGRAGQVITGQRGGLNVNAYLTLVAWIRGQVPFGTAVRDMPHSITATATATATTDSLAAAIEAGTVDVTLTPATTDQEAVN